MRDWQAAIQQGGDADVNLIVLMLWGQISRFSLGYPLNSVLFKELLLQAGCAQSNSVWSCLLLKLFPHSVKALKCCEHTQASEAAPGPPAGCDLGCHRQLCSPINAIKMRGMDKAQEDPEMSCHHLHGEAWHRQQGFAVLVGEHGQDRGLPPPSPRCWAAFLRVWNALQAGRSCPPCSKAPQSAGCC